MRNLILSVSVFIITLLIGVSSTSAQTIPLSMLPEAVAEMNKELPKEIEKGYVLNRFYLKPDNSCFVAEFIVDEKEMNLTSDEFINALEAVKPEDIQSMLGDAEWTEMLPVPFIFEYRFTDGKVYEIPLTAQKDSVTLSMLPDVVAEMNKELPEEIEDGIVMERVYLMPDNSGIVFEYKVNLKEAGMTSDDSLRMFETGKKDGEWKELSEMFPVPVFFELKCDDGRSFTLPISE